MGSQVVYFFSNFFQLNRAPAVHQGRHPDAAQGPAPLVRLLLPEPGRRGSPAGQGEARVPGAALGIRADPGPAEGAEQADGQPVDGAQVRPEVKVEGNLPVYPPPRGDTPLGRSGIIFSAVMNFHKDYRVTHHLDVNGRFDTTCRILAQKFWKMLSE